MPADIQALKAAVTSVSSAAGSMDASAIDAAGRDLTIAAANLAADVRDSTPCDPQLTKARELIMEGAAEYAGAGIDVQGLADALRRGSEPGVRSYTRLISAGFTNGGALMSRAAGLVRAATPSG
jgi:hypothetical protein